MERMYDRTTIEVLCRRDQTRSAGVQLESIATHPATHDALLCRPCVHHQGVSISVPAAETQTNFGLAMVSDDFKDLVPDGTSFEAPPQPNILPRSRTPLVINSLQRYRAITQLRTLSNLIDMRTLRETHYLNPSSRRRNVLTHARCRGTRARRYDLVEGG